MAGGGAYCVSLADQSPEPTASFSDFHDTHTHPCTDIPYTLIINQNNTDTLSRWCS